MTTAVFLDRDNTLIHNDGDLGDPDQVRMVKGAASAIASLRGLGYKIVVVSNQGGVARGKFGESDVQSVHERIAQLVKANSGAIIDRFYYCPYHPEGKIKKYRREHPWRKPQPGMLLQAAKDLQLDLSRCWLIGDQVRDTQAASVAGVRAILLRDDDAAATAGTTDDPTMNVPTPDGSEDVPAPGYWVAPSIIEAVKIIAKQGRTEHTIADTATVDPRRPKRPDTPATHRATSHRASARATAGVTAGKTPDEGEAQQLARSRPFRPWMTQPSDETPTPTAQHAPPTHTPTEDTPAAGVAIRVATPVAIDTAAPDPGKPPASLPVTPVDQTLRQILQELRNQRAAEAEFSYHHMMAIVLQMVAVVCLLGALWMGGSHFEAYIRWIGVGLIVQLATIAMLLFNR